MIERKSMEVTADQRRAPYPLNYAGKPLDHLDDSEALVRGLTLCNDDEVKEFVKRVAELRQPALYGNHEFERETAARRWINGMKELGRTPFFTATEMQLRIR